MARHEWLTRAELEAAFEAAGLCPLVVAEHGCRRCGAMRNLSDGEELPAEGCLDLEGYALP